MRFFPFLLLMCFPAFSQVQNFTVTHTGPSSPITGNLKQFNGQLYAAGWMNDGVRIQTHLSAYDLNGAVLWEKTYPRPERDEYFIAIDCDQNNVYCVGGTKDTAQTIWEGFIMRMTVTGDVIWRMDLPDVKLNDVVCTNNGGVIATGMATRLHIDSTGALLWSRTDSIAGHVSTSYGNVVLSGNYIYTMGGTHASPSLTPGIVIVKSDLNGQVIWARRYSSGTATWHAAAAGNDSDLFMACRVLWPSPSGNINCFGMIKIDSSGSLVATSGILPASPMNNINEIVYSSYNTLVAIGEAGGPTCNILEFDCTTLQCNRAISMPGLVSATGIEMDGAGNTWFSYTANSEGSIGGMDYGWNVGCSFGSYSFNLSPGQGALSPITLLADTALTMIPRTITDSSVTSSVNYCYNPLSAEEIPGTELLLYPNPATTTFTIALEKPAARAQSLSIFNAQGQLVDAIQLAAGQQSILVNTEGWCAGNYFLLCEDGRSAQFIVTEQ